jgi:hypothetical protein
MAMLNRQDGYGSLTKVLHWLVVALFAFQYTVANIMLGMDEKGLVLGLRQDTYYNWHKSIGLVALLVAALRVLARRSGRLPDWAPTLSEGERTFIHRAEQVLYTAMFVMPTRLSLRHGRRLRDQSVRRLEPAEPDRRLASSRHSCQVDAHRRRLRAGAHALRPSWAGAVAHAGAAGRPAPAHAAAA